MKKNIFKYLLLLIAVAAVGLTAFFSYNEYTYSKIGECFAVQDYTLAKIYADSISPSYKDVKKVKSLIETVSDFDKIKEKDYERTFSKLENFKGFKNEDINSAYNSFYFKLYTLMNPAVNTASTVSDSPSPVPAAPTTQQSTEQTSQSYENTQTVYYVESGEVYHLYRDCRSLANSKNVFSGPVPGGRRVCKICEGY